MVFAVLPALRAQTPFTAAMLALLFGALAYATYDLTNYATLRNWTLQITVLDIGYGGLASSVAATAAVFRRALAGALTDDVSLPRRGPLRRSRRPHGRTPKFRSFAVKSQSDFAIRGHRHGRNGGGSKDRSDDAQY